MPPEGHGDIEAKIPANAAMAAPDAQAMEKTRETLIPCAMAASWSNEVARMAMPIRVLKNRQMPRKASRAMTVAAM